MKQKIVAAVFFMALGFVAGGESYKYLALDVLNSNIEAGYSNDLIDTLDYLVIAKAIRDERYAEALSFAESMIENSVRHLPEYSIRGADGSAVLEKIKQYKNEDCDGQCLPKLSL